MIVVTGAAGFIASNLVRRLNAEGYNDVVIVDDFSVEAKRRNWDDLTYSQQVHRNEFISWIDSNHSLIQFIFHLGARTDTTEFNTQIFDELNLHYSQQVWTKCIEYGLPLVYASSAATYGNGEFGYDDDHIKINQLKPLNPYGDSKNDFDKWALAQERKPYFWAGLKFFNVYGPYEFHKGRMASVVFHSYNQIKQTGKVKLFKSHNPNYLDGEQLRDFVFVNDVTSVCLWLMESRKTSGIFNLGSGKARTFLSLTQATFAALNLDPIIEFVDTPLDIRDKYQYYTQANMAKLLVAGYPHPFTDLESGVKQYVDFLNTHT